MEFSTKNKLFNVLTFLIIITSPVSYIILLYLIIVIIYANAKRVITKIFKTKTDKE